MLRGQSAAQQPMLAQSLKGVAFTTVGAQYLCMHVVVVGTPGRSTTLNMGRCQVKTGGLVNDTTPVIFYARDGIFLDDHCKAKSEPSDTQEKV